MLAGEYDGVVMLTWSDWKTEPRSNRYHYATRLARHAPVLFVQPDLPDAEYRFEPTEVDGITLLRVYGNYASPHQGALLAEAIRRRGMASPLLWIYNSYLARFALSYPAALKVYHATEDYFSPRLLLGDNAQLVQALRGLLTGIDLVVACSEGVLASYRQRGGYRGAGLVLENGCDFDFYAPQDAAIRDILLRREDHVALFQGGINHRLDFALLEELVERLPQWSFWFCGAVASVEQQWQRLQRHPNVVYHGRVSPEQLRDLSRRATVGLMPFLQEEYITERSLPLKAFEYVACGLPVVSVPIQSLARFRDTFQFAATAGEFARNIELAALQAKDEAAFRQRLDVARRKDYDSCFQTLLVQIESERAAAAAVPAERLKVLVLYDDHSTHVNTIVDHLGALGSCSRHDVFYAPCTSNAPAELNLDAFDVVVIHYCVRVCFEGHLSLAWQRRLREFVGLKVLFLQDEYDNTEVARKFIEDAGAQVVYTILGPEGVEIVYPRKRFPTVRFVQTLTGYVPEELEAARQVKPLAERKLAICYRGRELGYWYGNLGREKLEIGRRMKEICDRRGIPCDIAWRAEDRIYGPAWVDFLQSARATLGTPSGTTLFDETGSVRRAVEAALAKDPNLTYEEVFELCLKAHEGRVPLDVLSPKIFEAIACRTALVLFEGAYNGAVEPGRHYIPLARDFSNVDEVLARIADDQYLEELTARAHRDVIASGNYSYRRFVADFDAVLSSCRRKDNRARLQTRVVGASFPEDPSRQLASIGYPAFLPGRQIERRVERPAPEAVEACLPAPPPGRAPLARRMARHLPPFVKKPLRRALGM